MTLFTIVTDYKGGTYLSQVMARNVDQALVRWVEQLDQVALGGLLSVELEALATDLKKETATPVQGLIGVWCTTLLLGDHLVLINVIENGVLVNR